MLRYAITALAVLCAMSATAQTPACGERGGTTTSTSLYEFSGPTDDIVVETTPVVGADILVTGSRGACRASCTIGTSGTCAANTFPVMTDCAIPARICAIGSGNTVLLTTVYFQYAQPALLTVGVNPSIVGMPVPLTAVLGFSTPTGSVTMRNASTSAALPGCQNLPVSATGVATCTYAAAATGSFPLAAVYSGNGINPPTTSATVTQVVKSCDLDVDASGKVTAHGDGVVILRRMLGMSGTSLTASVAPPSLSSNRTASADIADWIDAQRVTAPGGNRPLDLDDNGVVDAKTDGLMLLRALLGFRGSAVTQNALGTAPLGRSDWAAIRTHLNSNCGLTLTN